MWPACQLCNSFLNDQRRVNIDNSLGCAFTKYGSLIRKLLVISDSRKKFKYFLLIDSFSKKDGTFYCGFDLAIRFARCKYYGV